jgi:tetratricopeptide (TPR) repeat protein
MLAKLVGSLAALILVAATLDGQTDSQKFAEARTALDKHNDCPAALSALEGMSSESRNEPFWVYYMARTQECLSHLEKALEYYEQYDHLIPGQAKLLDKIGELRYRIRKMREEDEQRQRQIQAQRDAEAISAATRSREAAEAVAAEASRRQQAEDAHLKRMAAIAEARQRLPETLSSLAQLMSGKFEYRLPDDKFKVSMHRKVQSTLNCTISYREDDNLRTHLEVRMSLMGVQANWDTLRNASPAVYFVSVESSSIVFDGHNKSWTGNQAVFKLIDKGRAEDVVRLLNDSGLACAQE